MKDSQTLPPGRFETEPLTAAGGEPASELVSEPERAAAESSAAAAEAGHVQLKSYSGPLDMLLQLIRRREMDVFHINIREITDQYALCLKQASRPDLEKAGDFIRMAAILIYIKSRTLLQEEDSESGSEEENDRELKQNLIRLLAKCQKFQAAGRLLYQRELLGRDVWAAPRREAFPARADSPLLIDREKAPFLLMQSWGKILAIQAGRRPHAPAAALPSLIDRAMELAGSLIKGARLKFSRLAKIKKSPHSRLLTFLSLLELCRLGFVSLRQKAPFSDLDIKMKKTLDRGDFSLLNEGAARQKAFFGDGERVPRQRAERPVTEGVFR